MAFLFPLVEQPPLTLEEDTHHIIRNGFWQEQIGHSLEDTLREIQEIWSIAQQVTQVSNISQHNQDTVRGAIKHLYDADVPIIVGHEIGSYKVLPEEQVPFISGPPLDTCAEEELVRISRNLQAGNYKNPYALTEFMNNQSMNLIRAGTISMMVHATKRKETDPATEHSAILAIAGHITDHTLLGIEPFCATQAQRTEIMQQLNRNYLRAGTSAYRTSDMQEQTEKEFARALKQELAFIDDAFMRGEPGFTVLSKYYIGKTPYEWPTHTYTQ